MRLRTTTAAWSAAAAALLGFLAGPARGQASPESPWGWLPPNLNRTYGGEVDFLYLVIMGIVGVAFFVTEGLLLYCILRFRAAPGRAATYSHGNNKAEIAWSVVPGLILVWLALYQKDTWAKAKEEFPAETEAFVVQAFPEQFAWNFRYPGADGEFGTKDDIHAINQLHVPVGKPVLVKLTAKDVSHAVFLPHARVKQDAVPGMLTLAWFTADWVPCWDLRKQGSGFLDPGEGLVLLAPEEFRARRVAVNPADDYAPTHFAWTDERIGPTGQKRYRYDPPKGGKARFLENGAYSEGDAASADLIVHHLDIACAELCGLGHYKMRGLLTVEPEDSVATWLREVQEMGPPAEAAKWTEIWDKVHPAYNQRLGGRAAR